MFLIKNIKELIQVENECIPYRAGVKMQELNTLKKAWLLIKNNKIHDYGEMSNLSLEAQQATEVIDAEGKMVFPCFCDSHTHIVYANSREIEYIDKIKGLSYEEIAKRGGGILNSVQRLRNMSEDDLFESAWERLEEIKNYGTEPLKSRVAMD